jgi:hypothetical protein
MPITYTENIFNTKYRDDYADSDNYQRILFNTGRALQARELTQLQTIIQKQIERFGRNIFKDGAAVVPGGATLNNYYEFIKLNEATYTMPTDGSIIDDVFVGQTSAVRAQVIEAKAASGGDPATLFVRYTNTLNGTTSTDPIRMAPGEDLVGVSTGTVLSVQPTNTDANPAIGKGIRFSIGGGSFFVAGLFVYANPQDLIIEKYTSDVTVEIGFKVTQDIVTVDDTSDLYDNSTTNANTTAPGADRYRIRLDLVRKDNIAADDTFVYLAKLRDGEIIDAVTGFDQYNKINDVLALRTKEESGNYLVKPFNISYDSDADDATKLQLKVSEGTAYVNGYRAYKAIPSKIEVSRARDTIEIENEVVAADYGSYVIVDSPKGLPNVNTLSSVNLKDAADYQLGVTIGTARVKSFEAGIGSTYRMYLFDIKMNTGKTFRGVRSIGNSQTDYVNTVLENGNAVLKDADNESMLFALPKDRPSNLDDISFQVQRRFIATTDGTGAATLNLTATGETFSNTSDWLTSVDSSGDIITPSISGAGATSASISGAPFNTEIEVLTYVNKGQATARSKTYTTTNGVGPTTTVDGVEYVDLQLVDVDSIEYIREDSAGGADISHKFILDGGHRPSYYDLGRLILKTGATAPSNVAWSVNHYTHGATGDFFAVNSYSGQAYNNIPKYDTIDARNVLDFRSSVNLSGTFSGGNARVNELPKNTDVINADVTYYQPRWDRIVIDENSNISVLEGTSSLDPQFKEVPENSLELYRVKMNPYTDNSTDMEYQFIETKGYTMADIGNLEKRVDVLEDTTMLTLLELETNNIEILDSAGVNRTKTGFQVDNFGDTLQANLSSSEYRASVDPSEQLLHPAFVDEQVSLLFDSDESPDVNRMQDILCLPYTSEEYLSQSLASGIQNVNPFKVDGANGQILLSPTSDYWKADGNGEKVIQGGNKLTTDQSVLRNNHAWNWNGIDRSTSQNVKRVVTSETIRKVVGNRIVDAAVEPFMRSRLIHFVGINLRPNTRVIPFFDQVDVSDWCRAESEFVFWGLAGDEYGNTQKNATEHPDGKSNLTTNDNGFVRGSFFLPNTSNIRFRSGSREFTLLDVNEYDIVKSASAATGIYTSAGQLDTRNTNIISVKEAQPANVPGRKAINGLSQTFRVKEQTGVFISALDLWFKSKPDDVDARILVDIRPVIDGVPSEDIIVPRSNRSITVGSVNVSDDASSATTFSFGEPIYLAPNTEYSFQVRSDNPNFEIYTATMGDFELGSSTKRITKQPIAGNLFRPTNTGTREPAHDEDIKFNLYRCVFDTSTPGQAVLYNRSLPNRMLESNPIVTTSGDSEVFIKHPNHGRIVGDTVKISGVTGTVGGIDAADINGNRVITKVDGTGYTFNHSSNATSSDIGGGNAVLADENILADIIYPHIPNLSPDKTDIDINGNFHSGKSFAGLETAYVQDTANTSLTNMEANYMPYPKLVANTTWETANRSSAKVLIDMSTTDDFVSPIIDLQRASLIMVNNKIDKQAAVAATGFNVPINYVAETSKDEGTHLSKHVTKPVTLVNDAVGLQVMLSANRPSTANFDVYYKAIEKGTELSDVDWTKAELDIDVPSDENRNIFREYKYLIGGVGGNLDPFTTYQLKIVFTSTNSSKVATIKDLRVIALGV